MIHGPVHAHPFRGGRCSAGRLKKAIRSAAVSAALASAFAVLAQSAERPAQAVTLESALEMLHAAHNEQIRLAELAKSRTDNADVTALANDLVNAHRGFSKAVEGLAQRENIDLREAEVAEAGKDDVSGSGDAAAGKGSDASASGKAQLDGLGGAEFDREYTSRVARDHARLIETVQQILSDLQTDNPSLPSSRIGIGSLNFFQPRLKLLQDRAANLARQYGGDPELASEEPERTD